MEFDKHDLEIDGDRVWLLDADGQRLCDLNDMRLLDFEWRISVEGGLLNFDLEASEWRHGALPERVARAGRRCHPARSVTRQQVSAGSVSDSPG